MEQRSDSKESIGNYLGLVSEPEEKKDFPPEKVDNTIYSRIRVIRALYSRLDNDSIKEGLKDYNYDQWVEEGRIHYDNVWEKQSEHIKLQREKKTDTGRLNRIQATAQRRYSDYLKLSRVAFRENPTAQLKLELKGRRSKTFSIWTAQAKAFYHNALEEPELTEAFRDFGITSEKLAEGLALVEEAENIREDRNLKMALAQETTRNRDEALRKAEFWRRELIAIAEMALDPRIAKIISDKKLILKDPDTE
ncbi:MAG: hypothetical protein GY757_26095 [bacterium]|nr:hypothetical protein [bacterium]